MKKIIVGIPVWISCEQHKIFTEQTINSCKDYRTLVFVNNLVQGINDYRNEAFQEKLFKMNPKIAIFNQDINPDLSVSKTWNFLIKNGLEEAEYVLIINNDIIFHPQAIENLVKFAEAHPEYVMWTAAEWENLRTINDIPAEELAEDRFDEHPHFSAFMVNQRTIDKVGWFNENLERAYMEDYIYSFKLQRLGFKAGKTASARFYHFGSRTIKCSDELNRLNAVTYERNRLYVQRLIGVDPHGTTPEMVLDKAFEHPFNDPTKNWKDF